MFFKIGVPKNFTNFTGKNLLESHFNKGFNKAVGLYAYNKGVFLWNLRKSHLFLQNTSGGCFRTGSLRSRAFDLFYNLFLEFQEYTWFHLFVTIFHNIVLIIVFLALTWSIARNLIMLKAMAEDQNKSFTNISIFFLRSLSLWSAFTIISAKKIETVKIIFLFSIIGLNIMKLIAIILIIKLLTSINSFKNLLLTLPKTLWVTLLLRAVFELLDHFLCRQNICRKYLKNLCARFVLFIHIY